MTRAEILARDILHLKYISEDDEDEIERITRYIMCPDSKRCPWFKDGITKSGNACCSDCKYRWLLKEVEL